MTPSGIEPPTFRFAAQYLNRCATAVPQILLWHTNIFFVGEEAKSSSESDVPK